MQIKQAEISILAIPMKFEVQHALASRSLARNVIVCLTDENGIKAYGECCPREYVSGESIDSVVSALNERWFPKVQGLKFTNFSELQTWIASALTTLPRNEHAAFCALELALLDLYARGTEQSVLQLFSAQPQQPQRYSAVIASEKIENVAANAAMIKQFGVKACKVKLVSDLQHNHKILTTVRAALGDSMSLRGDANAAWQSADEAERQLSALSKYQMESIEQPLPAQDINGLAQLTSANITPVMVDESICSRADAQTLIDEKACHLFNLRISKCGGISNSLALAKKAADNGIDCQLGAQVGETSILSSAGLVLANLVPTLKWREGCFGQLLLEDDPMQPIVQLGAGGMANLQAGTGFGIQPEVVRWKRYLETA
ncbi:mandelate racemase/muconate lactonizing enzyme family protein [Corallincola spongiicola]|uniref:Mandelate racemase/muconate lactonizing enzyme C-terminal domain-containing protein n=1 Tax=Corallincola spongiicola TaxID=2520508 RepID=A0ABY1WV11_9GAMM|nr:enolase C-terminal domain-like protein [Corallincola spongiicola]TAA48458.1 hypothetical protein EXY25_04345 [Corallincola spongiicola]